MLLDGEKIPEPTDNYGFVKIQPSFKSNLKPKPAIRKKVTAHNRD